MLVNDFELIETILFIPDSGYCNLSEHLARLSQSGRYFGFYVDQMVLSHQLNLYSYQLPRHRPSRVRLRLYPQGKAELIAASVYDAKAHYLAKRLVLSEQVTYVKDVFYFHKTTHRTLYDHEYQRYCVNGDYYEVLFCNEQGYLTEGSRTNVYLKMPEDPIIYTPKLELGLLNGIIRAKLLARLPHMKEAWLTKEQLYQAEKIWLSNAVRGVVRAEILI